MADGQHSKKLVMLGFDCGPVGMAWRASKAFWKLFLPFYGFCLLFWWNITVRVFYE